MYDAHGVRFLCSTDAGGIVEVNQGMKYLAKR